MTYAEAVARLLGLRGGEQTGMRPGLDRIHTLLEALGHPERRYALVQVGGTNGKGSISAMLAAILKAAGRRVGLYTSPHLVSFRERIRVNGEAIPEDAVVDGVEAVATLAARLDCSVFEATTAMALDHFAREEIDVAVLEVGLGGRLDATTVGEPMVTVISAIDLDHQAYLGSTLADIAGEKAAIIRSGVAISAAQLPEAAAVIEARAARAGVPLLTAGRDLHVTVERRSLGGQQITCAGPDFTLPGLDLGLLGTFQPGNALLAVTAARHLGAFETAIRAGLRVAQWPGRFQVVGQGPWLVLDGAHNPGGARALADSLVAYFGGEPMTFVLGISEDKDARAMLRVLAPLARRLVLTAASSHRAAAPAALAAALPPGTVPHEIAASPAEALALAARDPRHPIRCVAGSLFLVGDVLRHLAGGDKPCRVEKAAASMDFLL